MPAFLRLSLLACLLFGAPAVGAATVYKYRDANGVIHLTDKPVKGARKIVFPDRMEEHLEKAVRVERRRLGRGEALWIVNDLYAPVEVELRLDHLGNVAHAPAGPVRQLLPPRSRTSMFSLQPANAASPMRYQTRLSVALGDPRATPAGDTFPLPWRGGPFSVSQGANGGYSHFTPKSRYAIDIAMPVGTPIIASRAGVVVKTENRQSGRGRDPSGNFVRVLHADGTMAVYLHLSQGSVRVKEGQRVAQGTLLGLSGNTGNSTGPHLHFVVQRNTGMGLVSIPFRFAEPVQDLPAVATGGR
jgi:murein DD-endopeptidase MepM/ murein hydrolase activator NlpD